MPTVFYEKVTKGCFLVRLNRFIAKVRINGCDYIVHVKNTGRCKELLLPETTVYLAESDNPLRKTRFDLIAVEKKCPNGKTVLINIDSQLPNAAIARWLPTSPLLPEKCTIRREVTYRNSRFDFLLESPDRKICLEVKGVTLENNGSALFPDAPTLRGVKHLNELVMACNDGMEAWLIFVIQMKGIKEFRPNDSMHPEFGRALRRAAGAGVKITALDCRVTPGSMTIDREIPVIL